MSQWCLLQMKVYLCVRKWLVNWRTLLSDVLKTDPKEYLRKDNIFQLDPTHQLDNSAHPLRLRSPHTRRTPSPRPRRPRRTNTWTAPECTLPSEAVGGSPSRLGRPDSGENRRRGSRGGRRGRRGRRRRSWYHTRSSRIRLWSRKLGKQVNI